MPAVAWETATFAPDDSRITWDHYESVWGFESDTYATEQAQESLPAGARSIAPADLADEYLED